jgi:phage protein D
MPVPDVDIRINGERLPHPARVDIQAVTVEEDLDALSMFTIVLYNWDQERLEVSWSDSALFNVGGEVTISLGYVGDLRQVMVAEITSLEPTFTAGRPPLLTVRGHDHRHRLARGRKTRSFRNMTDSQIATQVARGAGMFARVANTKTTLAYVAQTNQSDLQFLQKRAGSIGYEVYVKDKVLYFQPPQIAARPAAELTIGKDVTEFSPRLSTLAQVGTMAVRGWDPMRKLVVVGTAGAGEETATMGGAASGPRSANRAFGKTSVASIRRPVRSKAEADQVAYGQFNDMALSYVQGDLDCQGRPDLRAGTVVDVVGAGWTFSGPYYVTSVTHTMSPEGGYRTSLRVQRNAA